MEHLSEKRKITIMIAIMFAMFFSAINQTIIGVAMPRIIAKLGGMDYYTWVITIYLLTSTVSSILVGKLSDIYGRKPFILVGILLFMIGAFLSGFSKDIFQLIIYRGIQGFGAGVIMSTAFTAVGDLYAPRERAKWSGYMSGVFGISSVVGPPLGGYIVDHLEWHWVFWVFLPLGIFAFFMIMVYFPKVERKPGESIDYFGSLFMTLTIVPLLLALSLGGDGPNKYAWGSWEIISMFIAAAVSLLIFILVELKVKNPVLPLSLFKNSVVTVSNLAGFILNMAMMGAIIYVPFYVQGVKGISPTYSGYITMPLMVMLLLMGAISGQVIAKTGKYKNLAIFGLIIMGFGLVLLHFLKVDTPIYMTIIDMGVVGFGLGIAMPVFTLTVQNAVDQSQLGVATASSQLFRSLGGTIGIAIMGTIVSSKIASKMAELAAKAAAGAGGKINLDPALAEKLSPQTLLDQPKLKELEASLPPDVKVIFVKMIDMFREALSFAITNAFLMSAIVMILAIIITLFLKEVPLRSGKGQKVYEKLSESGSEA